MKKKILFLCTHNSARSQIAEGIINGFYSQNYEAFSAGTVATAVNPYAIRVMEELGIDISNHYSKTVESLGDIDFDLVVTVCDDARENCPVFLERKNYLHKSLNDPSDCEGDEGKKMKAFRNIRDEIREWIDHNF